MVEHFAVRVQDSAIPTRIFRLVPGITVLGRSTRCDVVIKHVSVSRRHAAIRVDGQRLVLRDLRSLNGTWLNDCRVDIADIKVGDRLCFGHVHAFVLRRQVDHDESDSNCPTPQCRPESRTIELPQHGLLSKAQSRVFDCLLQGLSEKEIATELHISVHTVHNHVQKIHRTYGVSSGKELLARVLRPSSTGASHPQSLGLLSPQDVGSSNGRWRASN